ncbi:MAG: hypothetical protein AB8E82_14560, partial [Aureispira sp.]
SNEGGDNYDRVTVLGGANVFEGKDYDVYYTSTYAGMGVPTRGRDANGVPLQGLWEAPMPLPSGAIDVFPIEDLAVISPKALAKGASKLLSKKAGTKGAENVVGSTRWMPNPAFGQVAIGAQLRKGAKISIEKSGTSTIYRAVSKAELDDIAQFGFRTKQGGYESGKLFAPTAGEAVQFGKNNFKFDEIPNHIMQVKVPNKVLNNSYKFPADGMNAISIPADKLNTLKGTPLNYTPLPE